MKKNYVNAMKMNELTAECMENMASFGIEFSRYYNCYILPGLTDVIAH